MTNPSKNLLDYIHVIVGVCRDDHHDDTQLLARFVEARDEKAFTTLLWRHGPMVWRMCTRVLGDGPDAEDAFQATFLALARKAGQLRGDTLAGWLHHVARQTALKADAGARRRRGLEQRLRDVTQSGGEGPIGRAEVYAALDEELACLPEQLRVPLVLRYLEGKTLEEVARIVGCSRPVVSKRLVRGETILRQRLEQRGLAVGIGSVAMLLGSTAIAPTLQAKLIGSTARMALRSLSFPLPESAEAVALAEGVLKTMGVIKVKIVAVLLGVTLCLAGGGVLAYQALAGNAPEPPQPAGNPRGEAEASRRPRAAARVDCYGDPLPAHALARMGTIRQWYDRLDFNPHNVLAFLPDDKTLVSQNWQRKDGLVCLWDAATGKEMRWIATPGADAVRWAGENILLALSLDGKTLAKGKSGAKGNEGTVYLWEVATGKLLHQLKRAQEPKREAGFVGITFLPNGKILTLDEAVNSDYRICLWDVATGGREISQLSDRKESIDSQTLAFSRDGKMMAAVSNGVNGRKLILWEVATGKKIRQLQLGGDAKVYSVAFSPSGKTLATGGNGGICVWEVATGKPIHRFKAGGGEFSCPLAYSPDGRALVGGWEGHLWDVATGEEIRLFDWEHARVAVFSHNGKVLAVGDEAGVIRLWEVATGKEILPHKGHQDRVISIAYSPDGKTLASGSGDQTIRLWEVETGKEIRRQLTKHTHWGLGSLAYSPDGKMIASTQDVIHLWDTATGKEIRQFQGKEHPLSVTFSPDGKLLAATLDGQTICLWEVATGKQIYTLEAERGIGCAPWSIAFSPNGRMLAAPGEKKGTVGLWEVATGKSIGQLQLKQGREVRSLAFSPDGRILATSNEEANGDRKIRVWEVASGKEICHWQAGYSLTFSPDGRILATIDREDEGKGKKIYLWEAATGKEIGQLAGHRGIVQTIAFSPDGKTLASGSDDLTCLVWDVTSFVARLKPVLTQPLGPQVLPKELLETAWADLAKDPAEAYAAVRALRAVPTQAIPLLRARVQPVAPVADPKQLKRWIADLDDNSFTVREKAQREIEKLGEVAGPALRQALKGQLALDVKRRLHALLAESGPKMVGGSPQRMRELRAVQVLESIGTAEARQVLHAWAKGVAGARLTVEAEAALARLAKQPAAKP